MRSEDHATLEDLVRRYVNAGLDPDKIIDQLQHMAGIMRRCRKNTNDPSVQAVEKFISDNYGLIYSNNNSHRHPKT